MSTIETVSDAELAWRKSFVFDHHKSAGVYKRKLNIEVDTAIWPDFNAALVNETSTTDLARQSAPVDNGRYSLECVMHKWVGKVGLYLVVKAGTLQQDTLPRAVTYNLSIEIPGSNEAVVLREFEYTFTEHEGYGCPDLLSLATLRQNPQFMSMSPKRLILKAAVEEFLSSERVVFLSSPAFYLRNLVTIVHCVSNEAKDALVRLGDGQVYTHTGLLNTRCAHFKKIFAGDFREGASSLSFETTTMLTDGEPPEESVDHATEKLADYDSDFDSSASPSHLSVTRIDRRDYRVVNLPNFSKATFDAFLLYLSTNSITFKPIKSAMSAYRLLNEVSMRSIHDGICLCSPKSMYVMADYFDVPALKVICESAFIAMIHPGNVLQELAHRFGRVYQPITQALESYAVKNWPQVTATASFDEDIQSLMEYEESRKSFASILKKASQA